MEAREYFEKEYGHEHMKLSEFFNIQEIKEAYSIKGTRRLRQIATEMRKCWHDFPKGRDKISLNDACQLIWVASSINVVKDVPEMVGKLMQAYNTQENSLPFLFISRMIQNNGIDDQRGKLKEIHISKLSGKTVFLFEGGKAVFEPKDTTVAEIEERTVIQGSFVEEMKKLSFQSKNSAKADGILEK